MGKILKLVGRGVKRAFTKDGGKLSTLKDIAGKRDQVYWIALAIRTLGPVIIAGLAYWFASMAGVPVSEFLDTMNSIDTN